MRGQLGCGILQAAKSKRSVLSAVRCDCAICHGMSGEPYGIPVPAAHPLHKFLKSNRTRQPQKQPHPAPRTGH